MSKDKNFDYLNTFDRESLIALVIEQQNYIENLKKQIIENK